MRILYELTRAIRAAKRLTLGKLATAYYQIVCAEFGNQSSVAWGTWIAQPWKVKIKNNVYIGSGVSIGSEYGKELLVIEDNTQINDGVSIDYTGGVLIGRNAFISENTHIYTHTHGLDPRATPTSSKLKIGSDAWIGAHCIILDKCNEIGTNSIIGIRTLVTRDVPNNTVFKNKI